ncbi:MAG: hypothetical protein JWQ81_7033 [Amycolatopsis sp.]|uniref:DUF4240 domain-containing protein n=1 Tax=Amycolatopsis sp. TaxID=37632 RepID=UPI00260A865B|nr:DUF4240 domain-containing protein [Amycolatopsis sp.]MCU1686294.1 hypothetical protein [Amycolatopsis sp.]
MNEREFWRLIGRAHRDRRRHATARDELRRRCRLSDSRETLTHLGRLLEELPMTELIRFHQHIERLHRQAYRWPMWTAFGLALAGADRAAVRDGICWLILSGRRRFRQVLAEPDALGSHQVEAAEVADAAELATIAARILMPDSGPGTGGPAGLFELDCYEEPPPDDGLPENFEALRRRFPRLAARHLPSGADAPDGPLVILPAQWCPDLDQTGVPR